MIGVSVTVLRKPSEKELEDALPGARRTEMTSVSVARTDDRGEYRVFGLRPAEYYVKATETGMAPYMGGGQDGGMGQQTMMVQVLGSQFAPMYFPGVLQLDQAQPVVLRAGEEVQADFAMRRIKLVEVAGRVMEPMAVQRPRRMCTFQRRGYRTGSVASTWDKETPTRVGE
jgi:hypothetical protein